MATKENKIKIVEKNPGPKIAVEQSGKKIIFGDDDLSIRCDNRQRDIPVVVDVCADDNKNLVIGVGVGRYYVAQVEIPAIKYVEVDDPVEEPAQGEDAAEAGSGSDAGTGSVKTHLEPLPLDMGDVVVVLWSLDDLTPANQ